MRNVVAVDDESSSSGSEDHGSLPKSGRKTGAGRRTLLQIGGCIAVSLVCLGVAGAVYARQRESGEEFSRSAEILGKPQGSEGDCCKEDEAKCHSCLVGETIEEFCYNRQHASKLPKGCETIIKKTDCCEGDSANCQSCQLGVTLEQFCENTPTAQGCKCAHIEQETDYPGGDLYHVFWVPTPEACCQRCRDEPRCTAWSHMTWGKKMCSLKSPVQLKRNPNMKGHTSGLPSSTANTDAIFQIKPITGICMQQEHETKHMKMERCDNTGNTAQQHFHYDRFKGTVKAVKSKECLTGANETGAKAVMAECDDTDARQRWDYFMNNTMRNRFSGLCLSALHRNSEGSHSFMMECKVDDPNQQWDMWYITPVDPKTLDKPPAISHRNHSLYCVASMLPWGGELLLLKMQYKKKKSLFGCEGYDVYSNVIVDLGGISTRMVYTDLHCNYGATVLNTHVFYHFWSQLLKDGRYLDYTWTVKLDPDAVFFPNRLHDVVRGKDHAAANEGNGMILNNCALGLHGPVEVVSRRGLETYAKNNEHCADILRWAPQEDVFIFNCMKRLKVTPKNQFDLLAEAHCHEPQWWSCKQGYVAFHPFKKVEAYEGCLNRAATAKWR